MTDTSNAADPVRAIRNYIVAGVVLQALGALLLSAAAPAAAGLGIFLAVACGAVGIAFLIIGCVAEGIRLARKVEHG